MVAKKAGLPGTNVIIAGPQGCGKTMALASLCKQLGTFPEEEMEERRNLAKDMGRPEGGGYSWMVDKLRTERERGISVDNTLTTFQSDSFTYFAVDTPGKEGFMKALLSVTSLADVAVLVVPAAVGEFEASMDSGRLREIALACFTMGIKHIVVWVTKMDDQSVDYASARFEDIKKIVNTFLKEVGYKQKEVPFVPISGIRGDNLVGKSSDTAWYTGKPVLESLDALGPIARPAEKPLRLPVLQVHENEDAGTIIVGRVETGSIKSGMKLLFSPSGFVGQVASIQKDDEQINEAKGGDIVSVALGNSVAATDLFRGIVASSVSEEPATAAETFVAQVVILDHPGAIRAGYCPAIAVHTAQVPCEFEELISVLDRKTKEQKANPEMAKTGEVVTVRLRPRTPVCVEAFSVYPSLGRFAVRDHNRTIGVGVVKEVAKRPVPKPRTSDDA